jgi:hypothetical protein
MDPVVAMAEADAWFSLLNERLCALLPTGQDKPYEVAFDDLAGEWFELLDQLAWVNSRLRPRLGGRARNHTRMTTIDNTYTIYEAARLLGLSPRQVRADIDRGNGNPLCWIPAIQVGRRWFIPRDFVDRRVEDFEAVLADEARHEANGEEEVDLGVWIPRGAWIPLAGVIDGVIPSGFGPSQDHQPGSA